MSTETSDEIGEITEIARFKAGWRNIYLTDGGLRLKRVQIHILCPVPRPADFLKVTMMQEV
ncbi:unnamed protein product [Mortierella alpina]